MDIVLDFETVNYGGVDLTKVGSTVYAQHPLTEIISCTFQAEGEVYLWTPECSPATLSWYVSNPHCIFIAHSAGFEKDIWRYIMVETHGFPPIPNERWRDTQAVAAWKALPQALEPLADVLELEHRKDPNGHKLMRSLAKPDKSGCFIRGSDEVYSYNRSDILCQSDLHRRLGPLSPSELQVWQLDQTINERGIRIDTDFCRAALRVVERASVPLLNEFHSLTGIRPGQRDKLIEWLETQGVYVNDLTKERVATLIGPEDAPFTEYEIDPKAARALRIRQLVNHSSTKKLQRMLDCTAFDGRAHRLLQYHGTGPGRWAGRLFQPQNFPRGTVRIDGEAPDPQLLVDAIMTGDPDYVETVIGSPAIECVASGLRHALIAAEGKTFNSGDFARIQCYLVLALAGQHDKCDLIAAGDDPYCDMASQIYRREITKRDKEERQTGKNTVLGCGFQMGPDKFCQQYVQECQCRGTNGPCQFDPVPDCRRFAASTINAYRKEWAPRIPQLWSALEDAALTTVLTKRQHDAYGVSFSIQDRWLTATLPSGNTLWYFDPKAIQKTMPWTDYEGDPVVKTAWRFKSWSGERGQLQLTDAYGGIITENVIMGMERALVVNAMFRCEREGFPVVLTGHDEILTEPERGDLKALEQIMTCRPAWAEAIRVPIQIEAWQGDRYRK